MKKAICLIATACSTGLSSSGGAASPLATPLRAGLSLGALKAGGVSLTADTGPIFLKGVSAGGEFFGLGLISARALIWERPELLSGFHGGPKIYVGFGRQITAQAGGEFGWNFRFQNKFDAGIGADLVIGEFLGGSLKVMIGYLF